MPTPKPGKETEKEFLSRCIPVVLKDGAAKDRKQAAAICGSMWRKAQKKGRSGDDEMAGKSYSVGIPLLHRGASVTSVDEENRTVELVWTTGQKTLRRGLFTGPWYEELEVSERAVMMDRLKSGRANLLDSHRSMGVNGVLGVVEDAWITGNKGYAKVRFSRAPEVDRVWNDVADGILRSISVGYRVHQFKETRRRPMAGEEAGDDGMVLIRRAVRWEPGELSLVSVPIDSGAYIRSGADGGEGLNRCMVLVEDSEMDEDQRGGAGTGENGAAHDGNDGTAVVPPKQDQQTRQQEGGNPPSNTRTAEDRPAQDAAQRQETQDEGGLRGVDPDTLNRVIEQQVTARLEAERKRTDLIRTTVGKFGLPDSFAEELIRGDCPESQVAQKVLDKVATMTGQAGNQVRFLSPVIDGRVNVERGQQSEDDTQLRGMQEYLLFRSGVEKELSEPAREFRGMRMLDLAREFLELRGVRTRGALPQRLAEDAMLYRAPIGYHTTTDFPQLLQGVGQRILADRYAQEARNYQLFYRRRTVTDYRPIGIYDVGGAPNLEQRNEAGEFIYKTFGEAVTTYRLVQYGAGLAFTREMLINDDLDVLAQFPGAFAISSARKENDAAYAVILANDNLSDGVPLFHANHGNLGTAGAPSPASLAAGYEAMSLQTDIDGNTVSITPQFILAPPRQRLTFAQLMASSYTPSAPEGVMPREFGVDLTQVYEPRLQVGLTLDGTLHAGSATEWYMIAPQSQSGLEYAYLQGEEGPQIETQADFDRKGIKMTCHLSFAAVAVHHRGVFKNPYAG